jgi:hypothetical protein
VQRRRRGQSHVHEGVSERVRGSGEGVTEPLRHNDGLTRRRLQVDAARGSVRPKVYRHLKGPIMRPRHAVRAFGAICIGGDTSRRCAGRLARSRGSR